MQVRASAKGVRMSARKAQLVVETIRGKPAEEALAVLRFLPHAAARAVDPAALRVVSATADQGPSYPPMYRPKARGQAGIVKRRTTHITVVVDDEPPAQRARR